MQPAVCVEHLRGRLFVLVVAQHDVGTAADDFSRDVLGVGRKYFHLHARGCLSAGAQLEARPVFVADDGGAFCHAVAHGVGEVYPFQELFYLLVEACAADDDFHEVASECLYHLFAHGCPYLVVDDGHLQQQLHGRCLQFGQHVLFDNLLDDERHGYNQVGSDFRECLEDDFRAGHAGQEEDVATHGEFIEELEGKSVHVRHGQHGDQLVAGFQRQYLEGEGGVRPQASVGQHHAFGVAGGAGGVVDDRQFVGLVFVIADVLLAEVFGIFLAEHFVEVFAGILQLFAARHQDGEVRHHHDAFQQGHRAFVEVFPHLVAHKEQFGFGVVHDVVDVVCLELVEDGHDDCAVGQRGKEGHAPVGTVAAADGNLVSFPDAACLENDV